jgi:hypothetical protein
MMRIRWISMSLLMAPWVMPVALAKRPPAPPTVQSPEPPEPPEAPEAPEPLEAPEPPEPPEPKVAMHCGDDDDSHGGRHEDNNDDDDHEISASLQVSGPVSFRLEVLEADVEVVAGAAGQVRLRAEETEAKSARLVSRGGNRVEVEFDGKPSMRTGRVRIELPPRSQVDLKLTAGDLRVTGVDGAVRAQNVSGDVRVERAAGGVDIRTVSGDVHVGGVRDAVRIQTVSGDTRVVTYDSPATSLDYNSVSGNLQWEGRCAAGCRIAARTHSGDLSLRLDPASAFEVRYDSHSGELEDSLGMKLEERPKEDEDSGGRWRARLGRGEGSIEVNSFSGNLSLKKR